MDGTITTDTSKSDGRLKVGVSSRKEKKCILKNLIGRGGPGLSSFKPVGYGKPSFSKSSSFSSPVVVSAKKTKLPSIASLVRSLKVKSPKFKTTSFKSPSIRKVKRISIVKGLIK